MWPANALGLGLGLGKSAYPPTHCPVSCVALISEMMHSACFWSSQLHAADT